MRAQVKPARTPGTSCGTETPRSALPDSRGRKLEAYQRRRLQQDAKRNHRTVASPATRTWKSPATSSPPHYHSRFRRGTRAIRRQQAAHVQVGSVAVCLGTTANEEPRATRGSVRNVKLLPPRRRPRHENLPLWSQPDLLKVVRLPRGNASSGTDWAPGNAHGVPCRPACLPDRQGRKNAKTLPAGTTRPGVFGTVGN